MLARVGVSAVAALVSASLLAATVADIVAAGGRAAPLILDVSDTAESIESQGAGTFRTFSAPDILRRATQSVTVSKPVLDQTQSDWDNVLDTNLRGAFFMSSIGRSSYACR